MKALNIFIIGKTLNHDRTIKVSQEPFVNSGFLYVLLSSCMKSLEYQRSISPVKGLVCGRPMQKGRSWGDLPSFPCSHLFAAQIIFLPAYCQHPFSEKRNHTWNRPVPCHTARVTTGWRWRPPLEESALSRYPPLSDEPSTRCLHVRPAATHLSSGSLWPETCIHAVIGFFFFSQNWLSKLTPPSMAVALTQEMRKPGRFPCVFINWHLGAWRRGETTGHIIIPTTVVWYRSEWGENPNWGVTKCGKL